MKRKKKYDKVPPSPPSGGRMKVIVRKIIWVINKTGGMKSDPEAIKILKDAKHWKNVTRKSHWKEMKRLGKDHADVIEMIEDVKTKGNEIVLNYDLKFGDRPAR